MDTISGKSGEDAKAERTKGRKRQSPKQSIRLKKPEVTCQEHRWGDDKFFLEKELRKRGI